MRCVRLRARGAGDRARRRGRAPRTPGDTAALADRLLRLTGNPRLRDAMGERARGNVQRFSEERVLERWEELFALLER